MHYQKLSYWIEPENLFSLLFAQKQKSFWLDSSLTNKENHFSYMGTPNEFITYSLATNTTNITKKEKTTHLSTDIFSFLNQYLQQKRQIPNNLPFTFTGGLVGYFGYELKALTGATPKYVSAYPDALWFVTENFFAFDHQGKNIYLISLRPKQQAEKWFKEVKKKLAQNPPPKSRTEAQKKKMPKTRLRLTKNHQQYLTDIARCKTSLKKGDAYQLCLTNSFTAQTKADPLRLYLTLRKTNPAPYAAYLRFNDLAILCSSPEEFLKIDNELIETKPMKGTIKKGKTPQEDKQLVKQLAHSSKDWSENAMIVDLLRNDLGKICEFGSIHIKNLMGIESYKTVHTLVSTITGKLQKDVSLIESIKACFPGGSITGAPKSKAMELLEKLERKPRGIYCGALGFLGYNKTAHLAIVIRTMIIKNEQVTIGSGGAILMDSDPEKEYQEMLLKAKALKKIVMSYNTPMHTIYLALGSNIGNKKKNIQQAVTLLKQHISDILVAKIYETKPMYYEEQDTFLNTVLQGKTNLTPQKLLAFIKQIETEIGRQKRFRNGPREIDIDILFYEDLIFVTKNLSIPHPRLQERNFVLKPFMDLDPNFVHPVLNETIRDLSNKLGTYSGN
jgi:para-aminobenzoate synthetase